MEQKVVLCYDKNVFKIKSKLDPIICTIQYPSIYWSLVRESIKQKTLISPSED